MRRIFTFFSGVVLGALVGAAVALLLTPASGEQLRGDIQTRYIELKEEVQQAADMRRQELEEQLRELRRPPKIEA
jgi:gas vesicle protein